jgi:hypothetical protein
LAIAHEYFIVVRQVHQIPISPRSVKNRFLTRSTTLAKASKLSRNCTLTPFSGYFFGKGLMICAVMNSAVMP